MIFFRSCNIKATDDHVLYHHCDAQPGSSGAGVYTWTKDQDGWFKRRLIGVFSGYRWKSFKEWWKKDAAFNAAIRLNTLKYTQICGWMGKYAANTCKQLNSSSS
jgi:serine protease 23